MWGVGVPRRVGSDKYQPLIAYLAALPAAEVTLTFPAIEAILGVALPAWAGQADFWTNRPRALFRQQPWVRAGWRVVRTDLRSEPSAVTFARRSPDTTA